MSKDESAIVNKFKVSTLESFPPYDNPFLHDYYHMGTQMGSNLVVMFAAHNDTKAKYIILVDTVSGRRVRVSIPSGE